MVGSSKLPRSDTTDVSLFIITGNQRVVYDYGDDSVAAPDGMTIDTTGKLWVTSSRGGEVRCIDPTTGEQDIWIF